MRNSTVSIPENKESFDNAIKKSTLNTVPPLLEFPAIVNNIAAKDNNAFFWATSDANLAIVNRFLEFPEVATKDNYAFYLEPKADQNEITNTDVAMHESRVLQFSKAKSSNAPLTERFDDMQLDSNKSEPLSTRLQKP
ncbi:hypothetical protein CC99x_006435 [Candidatus Berkiella cookevillensis]|uniref:Uncharacterized protein n=1 Tax=Candidatus Berkiella cookevillensis TaxID=437022 RepID=A0A0Q9YUT2_9GAMM|nr:hypothetical protein [Candidatus Berkiella cookevillensis]MCS5708544.1 hypothetical protein [Candidatus Berkiella cookevillensis]